MSTTLATWMTTVGVIGLGYVGLPLAVAFAQEGCEVVAVDVDARKVEAIDAGESYIEDVSSEALEGGARAHPRGHPLRAAGEGRRGAGVRADAADAQPRARPRPADRRHARARGRAAGRSAGGARVDHLSRHHARAGRAAAGGVGSGGRQGLPPGVLARAGGPGPHGLHAAQHAEGRRRADRGVRRARAGALRRWSATTSCACRAPRRPS